jgi:hypothetical protein
MGKPFVFLTVLLMASTLLAEVIPLDSGVHSFVKTYCVSCHGPEKQKGDRVLHEFAVETADSWGVDVAKREHVQLLQDVLDQLNLGEMPPEKKNVKQPQRAEVRHVVNWLTHNLTTLEQGRGPASTVMRRLNRREYRHTMRDLLGLRDLPFDPTEKFPADDKVEGFTNIGEALNLSDDHLINYWTAAENYLDKALYFGNPPALQTIRLTPEDWGFPTHEKRTPWMYRLTTAGKYVDIGCGLRPLSQHIGLVSKPKRLAVSGGIQTPGYYRIRIRAEAIHRLTHPYDPAMIPCALAQPMQLGLYVARERDGLVAGGSKLRKKLATWELSDHQVESYETEVWLEQGAIPFVNWENGPGPSDWWMRNICKKYHEDIEFRGKEGSHAWHVIGKNVVPGRMVSDVWQGPLMRIHSFELTGPLPPTYMSRLQRDLGGIHDVDKIDLRAGLRRFAARAFRRPVTAAEIEPFAQLAERHENELEQPREQAYRSAFKALLVSPDFLYLKEIGKNGWLSKRELANRMSYFLWSSIPDGELLGSALTQADVRREQAARMVADETRVRALMEGLMDSWLRYDKLGTMPPDKRRFSLYYRWGLEAAMREETRLFLSDALRKNRPIRNFIDSDYSFVNDDLARHYGMKGVTGIEFRRVKMPKQQGRGGLLGQAGILTLSANGVDTSPVVRGIWVLECILGTPPAPPPPDVEPLDPDTRGAKTLKQRLAKHRSIETCADCHAKIDPLGFPLEFYDPIGGYRARYDKPSGSRLGAGAGPKVDGSATLATGEQFANLNELKALLMTRQEQFIRGLAETLMTYALGREMTWRDHAEIADIAQTASAREYGFRDLVLAVAASETFARR